MKKKFYGEMNETYTRTDWQNSRGNVTYQLERWNKLEDGDDIEVNLAGTFAKDKFIVIKNKTKDPVVSALPHPLFDYEKNVFTEDGREQYMKEQWIKKEKKWILSTLKKQL